MMVDYVLIGIAIAVVLHAIIHFFDVTLWQCTQFGNCPWYLGWMK